MISPTCGVRMHFCFSRKKNLFARIGDKKTQSSVFWSTSADVVDCLPETRFLSDKLEKLRQFRNSSLFQATLVVPWASSLEPVSSQSLNCLTPLFTTIWRRSWSNTERGDMHTQNAGKWCAFLLLILKHGTQTMFPCSQTNDHIHPSRRHLDLEFWVAKPLPISECEPPWWLKLWGLAHILCVSFFQEKHEEEEVWFVASQNKGIATAVQKSSWENTQHDTGLSAASIPECQVINDLFHVTCTQTDKVPCIKLRLRFISFLLWWCGTCAALAKSDRVAFVSVQSMSCLHWPLRWNGRNTVHHDAMCAYWQWYSILSRERRADTKQESRRCTPFVLYNIHGYVCLKHCSMLSKSLKSKMCFLCSRNQHFCSNWANNFV